MLMLCGHHLQVLYIFFLCILSLKSSGTTEHDLVRGNSLYGRAPHLPETGAWLPAARSCPGRALDHWEGLYSPSEYPVPAGAWHSIANTKHHDTFREGLWEKGEKKKKFCLFFEQEIPPIFFVCLALKIIRLASLSAFHVYQQPGLVSG